MVSVHELEATVWPLTWVVVELDAVRGERAAGRAPAAAGGDEQRRGGVAQAERDERAGHAAVEVVVGLGGVHVDREHA